MQVKPFEEQGRFTGFHNSILDEVMPKLSGNAWKCLSFIIRKTKGWHKDSDDLSFSQIKAGTGIRTNHTVANSLKQLEDMNLIIVKRHSDQWASNTYTLNRNLQLSIDTPPGAENAPVEEPPSAKIAPDTSAENAPGSSAKIAHTKETKKQRNITPSQEMFQALADVCEYDLSLITEKERGQLNQAEKKMRDNGYTPADVEKFGKWWYANDWRGQKGQPPTLNDIRKTWGQFMKGKRDAHERRYPEPTIDMEALKVLRQQVANA